MVQRILTLILLLCSTSTFVRLFDMPGRSQFVSVDRTSVFDFQQNQHGPDLIWQVKDGYYLYREQISIAPSRADITETKLPPGVWYGDEFYGKNEIYRKQLTVPTAVNQAKSSVTLTTTYQDCTDTKFCYPPETKTVPLSEMSAGLAVAPAPAPVIADPQEKPQPIARLSSSAPRTLLIGTDIAFTPCIPPIYPLTSGIALGDKQRLSTGWVLLLMFIYIQGVALIYIALGLVIAAAGLQLQAVLQHSYVLIGLVVIFTLLALSVFGPFTLQSPSSL